MKTLRKTLSIVLTVAVLMTVFAGMFTNTASAYTYSDNNLLALDFDDAKGIANWTANEIWSTKDTVSEELKGQLKWGAEFTTDPEDPTNGVFYMWNTAYNSFSAQLGTPDSTGVSDDDAFCMEAGKTYTLTFKYKFKAGTGTATRNNTAAFTAAQITMYKGAQVAYTPATAKTSLGSPVNHSLTADTANVKSLGTYTAIDSTYGTYERYVYENDTDWKVGTTTITGDSTKNNIFFTISAGSKEIIGTGGENASFIGLYLDDICVTETSGANAAEIAETKSYVYDWKDAAGNVMPLSDFGKDAAGGNTDRHAWFSNSNTAKGQSYLTEEGAVLYSTQSVPSIYPHANNAFIHKICLKDPDFTLSNSQTDVKGFLSLEAGHIYTITAKVKPYGNSNPASVKVGIGLSEAVSAGMSSAYGTLNCISIDGTDTDTWSYVSATVDGDGKWALFTNTSSATEDNAGRVPCVFTTQNSTILIESVTVTVAKKTNYYNVESYELDKAAVIKAAANSASNVYSDAFRNVLKTVTNNEITVTPSSTGLQRIPFFTGEYHDKVNYNYINNISLKKGNTYRLELEYAYDATVEGATNLSVGWMHTTMSAAANASLTSSWADGKAICQNVESKGTKSDYKYLDYIFTADDAADGMYLLLRFSSTNGTNKGTVTIKSAKVTVIENNTSTNVAFTSAAKRSIRAESKDGAYVSAGLRFRGTLTAAQYENAAEVGFIAIPSALIDESKAWFEIDANGNIANANAKKVECTNKVYATGTSTRDYQLILTNLTQNGANKDLKDTKFSVVMYTKDANGVYSYYFVKESSYNEVKAAYVEKDAANADIY